MKNIVGVAKSAGIAAMLSEQFWYGVMPDGKVMIWTQSRTEGQARQRMLAAISATKAATWQDAIDRGYSVQYI